MTLKLRDPICIKILQDAGRGMSDLITSVWVFINYPWSHRNEQGKITQQVVKPLKWLVISGMLLPSFHQISLFFQKGNQ